MATKPKVSSITVKVKGGEPEFDTTTERTANVFIELQDDSVLIDSNDEFVLYLYREGHRSTLLEYPQGEGNRLTGGQLESHTERTYLFKPEYDFLPAINGEYPYRFQKITFNVFPSINPNSEWRTLEFPDSQANFQIIPPVT